MLYALVRESRVLVSLCSRVIALSPALAESHQASDAAQPPSGLPWWLRGVRFPKNAKRDVRGVCCCVRQSVRRHASVSAERQHFLSPTQQLPPRSYSGRAPTGSVPSCFSYFNLPFVQRGGVRGYKRSDLEVLFFSRYSPATL